MNDMTDKDWKSKLSEDQYRVLREKGTEPPFSGEFLDHDKKGVYTCAACGSELFTSDSKFHGPPPNHGWPSFTQALDSGAVKLEGDSSYGMRRTEVTCAKCGGHLGHLFDDGPTSDGNDHYCINSVALDFKPPKDD